MMFADTLTTLYAVGELSLLGLALDLVVSHWWHMVERPEVFSDPKVPHWMEKCTVLKGILHYTFTTSWRDPDDVSHCQILSPDNTKWRLVSATLCGWRRCFVADQLWLMTRIREEEDCMLWSVPAASAIHLAATVHGEFIILVAGKRPSLLMVGNNDEMYDKKPQRYAEDNVTQW